MVQLSMMGPLIAEGPALCLSRLGLQIDLLLKKKKEKVKCSSSAPSQGIPSA